MDWSAPIELTVNVLRDTKAAQPAFLQIALGVGAIASPVIVLVGVIWSNMNTRLSISRSTENVGNQIAAAGEVAAEARATASAVAQAQIEAASENARRQARAGVISAGRLRWIDAIRDDVAETLSVSRTYTMVMADIKSMATAKKPGSLSELLARQQILEERLQTLLYRIELRLTAGKPLHDALISSLKPLVFSTGPTVDYKQHESVVLAGRELFYTEWKRLRSEVGDDAGPEQGAPVSLQESATDLEPGLAPATPPKRKRKPKVT